MTAAAELRERDRSLEERALGFWIYLMSDAVLFALLFATYAVMRHGTAGGPTAGELFELPRTLQETILLLTSSMTFGLANIATGAGRKAQTLLWLLATFLLGLGFLALEITEFRGMIAAGAGPDRSGFLSAFFTLVGTHGLHVAMGLAWIVILSIQAIAVGITPQVVSRLYRLGLFWHFLDIVWVGIFSTVYLPGML